MQARVAAVFPSRNREAFLFKIVDLLPDTELRSFRSRNREAFLFKITTSHSQNRTGCHFDLGIEKLFFSRLRRDSECASARYVSISESRSFSFQKFDDFCWDHRPGKFPSRDREAFLFKSNMPVANAGYFGFHLGIEKLFFSSAKGSPVRYRRD